MKLNSVSELLDLWICKFSLGLKAPKMVSEMIGFGDHNDIKATIGFGDPPNNLR